MAKTTKSKEKHIKHSASHAGRTAKTSTYSKTKNTSTKDNLPHAHKIVAMRKSKVSSNSGKRKAATSSTLARKAKSAGKGLVMNVRKKINKSVVIKSAKKTQVSKRCNNSKPKNALKIVAAKSTGVALGVRRRTAGVSNEFMKILKAEIAAAFDVCLAAMEHTVNLMESRLATVLGEMSNLVTGAKPKFKCGKLESIVSDDGKETTNFSYGSDGLVTSRTYRDGKLKFEIVHGKLGNPLCGKMFGPSGEVVKEFSYSPDGQVK